MTRSILAALLLFPANVSAVALVSEPLDGYGPAQPVTVVMSAPTTYSGLATWFPASGYQGAVPWWKPGQDPLVVAVSAFRDGRTYSTSVLVTGWCACGDRAGLPTVIDLSPRAFAELAPLSVGVVSVQVELPTQGPVLPATSTK